MATAAQREPSCGVCVIHLAMFGAAYYTVLSYVFGLVSLKIHRELLEIGIVSHYRTAHGPSK